MRPRNPTAHVMSAAARQQANSLQRAGHHIASMAMQELRSGNGTRRRTIFDARRFLGAGGSENYCPVADLSVG